MTPSNENRRGKKREKETETGGCAGSNDMVQLNLCHNLGKDGGQIGGTLM